MDAINIVIGQSALIILGLSFLMFGVRLFSNSIENIISIIELNIFKLIEKYNIFALFIGVLLSVFLQSSSIAVIILMILSYKRFITVKATIPIMLGITIGTSIHFFLASFNNYNLYLGLVFIIASQLFFFFDKKLATKNYSISLMSLGMIFFGWFLLISGVESTFSKMVINILNNSLLESNYPLISSFGQGVLSSLVTQSVPIVVQFLGHQSINGENILVFVGIILGANLGIIFLPLFVSLFMGVYAKRIAFIHALIKIFGILIAFLTLKTLLNTIDFVFYDLFKIQSMNRVEGIHLGLNIVNSLTLYFLIHPLEVLSKKIFKISQTLEKIKYSGIVQSMLSSIPNIALKELKKEWPSLAKRVKGFEDEIFEYLENHLIDTPPNKLEVKNLMKEISSAVNILIRIQGDSSVDNEQLSNLLSKYQDLINLLEKINHLLEILHELPINLIKKLRKEVKFFFKLKQIRSTSWKYVFFGEKSDEEFSYIELDYWRISSELVVLKSLSNKHKINVSNLKFLMFEVMDSHMRLVRQDFQERTNEEIDSDDQVEESIYDDGDDDSES